MDELLDTAPCGFLSFRDDGTIELANATLLGMLGRADDDLCGAHIESILTVGTRIFYQTHWFPLLRMQGRAEEIFLMLRGRDGAEIGMLVNAVQRDRGGHVVYDCILMQVRERQKYEDELLRAKRAAEHARGVLEAQRSDLQAANQQLEEQAVELELQQQHLREQTEELERARAAAEEANQAKSTFLAVMSHELRTPLNAISGYVELLDIGIYGMVNDAQKDALARINRSQRHLLRLINDVLNLARIEAGRVDYTMTDVPLAPVIEEVTAMVEPQLAAKGLAFEVDFAPGLVVRADRDKTQQILLNLLSNAVKFTPAGGRVAVDAITDGDGGMVEIRVVDTGIGIPEDQLARVFEPFVQVDVSQKSRKEGTGLGLAISRDLARGMGGDLMAQSSEGEGSAFTLALQHAAGSGVSARRAAT